MPNRSTFTFRLLLVLGALAAAPLACSDSTGNDEREAPAELQLLSGDEQEAAAGAELPDPVVVRVLDSEGDPIRGQLVNFRVTSGGGSVFSGSALTNANGEAQERWTLGTSTAVPQRLEARAVDQESGAAVVFATFEATVLPGAPHQLEAVSGAAVEGTAGVALGTPLAVAVFDRHGNPVPGVTVTWVPGAGSVAPIAATTDAAGRASAVWTLGTQAGAQTATATVAGLPPVSFSVAARAGVPASLEIVSGGGQLATVGSALGTPLTVRAKDAHGNVIVASTVEWAVVAGSGTLASAQSATGGDGTASNTLTLGTAVGDVRVRASAGAAPLVEFVATATAGAATRVDIIDGGGQEGTVGQALANLIIGVVRDQYGNPVAGVTVTWLTPDGGWFSPASSQSSATGSVTANWTLGPSSGTQTVRATAAGLQEGSATATARPGSAAAIAILSGSGQSAAIGSMLAAPLVAVVRDAFGNAVRAGVAVQWSVVVGAATLSSGETVTAADGSASVQVTLGTSAGEVRIRATAASGQSVDFLVQVAGGPPNRIEKVDGDGQSGVVSTELTRPLIVRVLDEFGNASPGATVRWEGTGQFDPHLATTDADGRASTVWRLGAVAGAQSATAAVDGTTLSPATFTATGTPGVAGTLDIVSGGGQSGVVGQPLSQPLVVLVRDSRLNPVPGETVSFTIVSGIGTLNPQQPAADASGHASTTLTLGTTAGSVRVRAQLSSGFWVEFTSTALPGALSQLIPLSSLDQEVRLPATSAVGQVRAADQYGNGIGGVQVNWTVLSGSGTVTSPSTVSIASGLAQTAWSLGPEPVQTLRASAGAIVSPVFTARLLGAATWARVTLPTSAPLRDIWGTSADNIYAVGDGGTVLHFDGTTWERIDVGTTADLTEVLGTTPNDIRLAGSGQRIHFNGTSWAPVSWPTLPSPGRLKEFRGPAFARVAADDAMAIIEGVNYGGRDTVKHWNGTAWIPELVITDTEGAYAIWMAPDGRALVGMSRVGSAGSGYHYDGTSWRTGLGGGRVTEGYAGKSFDNVFIKMNSLGGCCSFAHSNGTTWDYNPGGAFGGQPLWFVSPNEVYYRNGTEVRRLRSGEFQSNGAGTAEGVNGSVMWGTSSTNLYLIGTDGSLWRKSPPS